MIMLRYGLMMMVLLSAVSALGEKKVSKWEKDIQRFEEIDKKNPPKKESVLFLGSSSIRMWKLDKWFEGKAYINRGFGGSEISDSIEFMDRIVIPYKPKTIVFYAGDNDISKGKTAERVFKDYQTFVEKVHRELPNTRVLFVAIKPSISRWKLSGEMKKANDMIAKYSEKDKRLSYVDIWTPMLNEEGKPAKKWFIKDNLHLSEAGYELWTGIVKKELAQREKPSEDKGE